MWCGRSTVGTENADALGCRGAATSSRCAALPTVDTAADRETAECSEANSTAIARSRNDGSRDAAAFEPSDQSEISSRASRMSVGGRVHTQFAHSSVEGEKSSDFFISRARLLFEVSLNDFVEGRLEHDFVGGLRDAFLRLNFDPAFRLSLPAHRGATVLRP